MPELDQEVWPPSARPHLSEISCPCLLIEGSEDVGFIRQHNRELLENLNNPQHHVFEGVAHLPSMERPEEFNELLQSFLNDVA